MIKPLAARCAAPIISCALAGLSIGTAQAAASQGLTFEQAILTAMTQSPEVAARENQVAAARSAAIPAGALPDPKLFAGVDNYPVTGPNAGTFHDEMTMLTAGVMQEFPNAEKRRARIERAQADIGVATLEVLADHRELATAAALAWLDLYYAQKRVDALESVEGENRLLAQTLSPRIATGAATAAEATAPKLQETALEDRRTMLRAAVAKARAELRRWIGPVADEPIADESPALAFDPGTLRAKLDQHPAVKVFEPTIARADAETHEAIAGKRSDWGIEGAVHQRDPQFGWMVSARVTLSLPLFASTRQDPLIAAKGAEANRVRLERDATYRRLLAEFDSDLADYTAAKEAADRMRNMTLPLQQQKLELQTASYRAGQAPIDAVLSARREKVEAELTAIERDAAAAKAAAKLAVYFGKDAS